jgi:X-Pro dipeptidyl-peptidase
MTRSRAVVVTMLAAFALAPAATAAGPPASVRPTSAPPASAAAGDAFTLAGKVSNTSRRAARVRLTVSLRATRTSKNGRIAAVKYVPKLKPQRSRGYRVRVRVPASLAAGRYHVVTCVRVGNRAARCVFAKRRLAVEPAGRPRAGGAPPPAPGAPRSDAAEPPPGPVVKKGATQPVYGYADAIRQRVWVPIELDSDGDGTNDRIAVDIIRPKATAGGLKVPIIMDASPYYDTVCRGNEGECKSDVDGDGLNDKWPLFYDNYFVPRGYAVALLDTVGTNNSTGCPTVGGREDILGITRVIDWLGGRATGYDAQSGGAKVTADWSTGNVGMWGKSFDGTHANGAAATGVEGLRTIVPISGISSWYKYYRIGGLRFSSGGPSGLANTVTFPARREQCAPSRQRIASNAGEGTVSPETSGNFNAFWDERDYEKYADRVEASVFLVHGLNDYNVKPNNYDEWWDNLAANDVPRKIWLTQMGHVDPFDFDRGAWVDTIHRWFDYWLQDIDNGVMDEPLARIEQQPNLVGRTPTFKTFADFPDPGAERTQLWLRSPAAANGPAPLSTSQQQTAATATWIDRREQYVERTPGSAPPEEKPAIADPTATTNPNRLVALSPVLTKGVRISGRSSVTLRLSADQADAALGAVLVDYGDAPFDVVDFRNGDGAVTLSDQPEDCFGENSLFDNGCYFPVGRRYRTTAMEVVSRGALDLQNRDSLRTKTPLTPGQDVWAQVPLWTNDYTFLAGHRIGVVLVGTFRDYSTQAKTGPVPTYEVNIEQSRLTLPVVGGRDALGF